MTCRILQSSLLLVSLSLSSCASFADDQRYYRGSGYPVYGSAWPDARYREYRAEPQYQRYPAPAYGYRPVEVRYVYVPVNWREPVPRYPQPGQPRYGHEHHDWQHDHDRSHRHDRDEGRGWRLQR